MLLFEAIQTNTGKQSIHSHPVAIRLTGVNSFNYVYYTVRMRILDKDIKIKWIILRLSTFCVVIRRFIFSYDFFMEV